MLINFSDIYGAQQLHPRYDHVLGLGDQVLEGRLIRHLNIDDVVDVSLASVNAAPTYEKVASVGDWFKTLPDEESLLIHCLAGFSRSPAITILALVLKGGLSFDRAYMGINKYRVPYVIGTSPNELIIQFVREYLTK